jgi:hypothetical protein
MANICISCLQEYEVSAHSGLTAMGILTLSVLLEQKAVKTATKTNSKVTGKLAEQIGAVLLTASERTLSIPPGLQSMATDLVPSEIFDKLKEHKNKKR